MNPSWQQDACPQWCAGDHREDDLLDDRVHRSWGVATPVVSRRLNPDAPESVHAGEYEVGLSRRDGSRETWVYVGSGPDEHIEVTLESAERLIEVLREVTSSAHD